jgi:sodium/potassium/calcium exchanger 6
MILSIFSVPAILVLTLTLPVVDDGNNDREGGIALPESSEEPLAMPDFDLDLENGPEDDEEEEEGDGLLRPEIGEGLHHLVEGGFSPLHSPLGRIHHSRQRGNSSPGSIDDECCGDEDELDLNRDEALEFNKSLTAAQCVFGPTFCAYIIFSESAQPLTLSLRSFLRISVCCQKKNGTSSW